MNTTDQTPVSDKDVVEFLEQVGANPECPCCKKTQWHRLAEPLPGYNYSVTPFVQRLGTGMVEVVVLYCTNCGFVRQHAAHLIRKWAERKQNGKA